VPYFLLLIFIYTLNFYVVNVPDTVNVATLQPPAGAGNVVTVFVPGLAEIPAAPGALIITIPEPPDAPLDVGVVGPAGLVNPPLPPLPVLAEAAADPLPPDPPVE
jgi:hypothetical protein